MLHELVKLVHIDIHEELRGQVPEGQAEARFCTLEAAYDLSEEPKHVAIWYTLLEYPHEALLVYGGEELTHVALQYPNRTGVIVGDAVREPLEMLVCLVISLTLPARVRASYEGLVEKRIQETVNRVVEKAVAHARFVYAAGLRVRDVERFVVRMGVRLLA